MPAVTDFFDIRGIDPQDYRKKLAMGLMQSGADVSPIRSWTQGAARMAQALVGGQMMNQAQQQQQASYKPIIDLMQGYGGGQQSMPQGAPNQVSQGAPAGQPGAAQTTYKLAALQQETGGDPNAQALTSSARGPYQITRPTWDDLSRTHPELNLTPEGFSDPKSHMDQHDRAMDTLTARNAIALKSNNIDPNPQNLYMAHFLGAQGGPSFINQMQQNPNAPATALVSPEAARANQNVFFNKDGTPRTAQQVYDLQTKNFANVAAPTGGSALAFATESDSTIPAGARPTQQPGQIPQGAVNQIPQGAMAGGTIHPELRNNIIEMLKSDSPTVQRYGANLANALISQQMALPTFGTIGHDILQQPVMGWIDPARRAITPVSVSGTQMAQAGGGTGQPGELYNALPKPQQDIVDAMIEGRQLLPTSFALKTPYWNNLIAAANDKERMLGNPSGFDQTVWNARVKTRGEFAAGGQNTPAGAITAGNTAIQHLGQLSDVGEKLNNWQGWGLANKPLNWLTQISREMSQDPRLSEFDSIRNKYIEEATKFYRGTGGNEADLQREIQTLNSAQSPAQLHAAIAAQVNLMQSKIDVLQQRWHQGMGPAVQADWPIIQPKSQQALDRINTRLVGGSPQQQQAGQPSSQQSQPQPQSMQQVDPLSQAKAAIANGAPRDAVIQRLQKLGISPEGL